MCQSTPQSLRLPSGSLSTLSTSDEGRGVVPLFGRLFYCYTYPVFSWTSGKGSETRVFCYENYINEEVRQEV